MINEENRLVPVVKLLEARMADVLNLSFRAHKSSICLYINKQDEYLLLGTNLHKWDPGTKIIHRESSTKEILLRY